MIRRAAMAVSERDGNSVEMSEGKLFEPKNHVFLPFKTCRGKLCIVIIIIIMVDLQCLQQLG